MMTEKEELNTSEKNPAPVPLCSPQTLLHCPVIELRHKLQQLVLIRALLFLVKKKKAEGAGVVPILTARQLLKF